MAEFTLSAFWVPYLLVIIFAVAQIVVMPLLGFSKMASAVVQAYAAVSALFQMLLVHNIVWSNSLSLTFLIVGFVCLISPLIIIVTAVEVRIVRYENDGDGVFFSSALWSQSVFSFLLIALLPEGIQTLFKLIGA